MNLDRRDFLVLSGTGVAGYLAGQVLPASPAWAAEAGEKVYPLVDIGPVSGLPVGAAIEFRYPDEDSPAVMIHLGEPAKDGIGPNNAVVAYSTLCTHKGCPVKFHPERKMLICPCHWSTFDAAKSGNIVIGQASQPLPQIKLRLDGDLVQAYGVDGLIYGRHTNIL
ncbi:MAG: arsenate reductase (azurin) small subunit [Rhodospirillales bacterium]|nr:arsenate reductase (azurin) small subunit [Rhodospirillales bacterium]